MSLLENPQASDLLLKMPSIREQICGPRDVSAWDVLERTPWPNLLLAIVSGKQVPPLKVTVTEGSSTERQGSGTWGHRDRRRRAVPEQPLSWTGSGLGSDGPEPDANVALHVRVRVLRMPL